MTDEILVVLNTIKTYHECELALKVAPKFTIHEKPEKLLQIRLTEF